ncbi:MAG: type II secretion system protein GspD [Firmicutes bacterium]|nr:type II secretion system protein GspD [Bacillota bacterium]
MKSFTRLCTSLLGLLILVLLLVAPIQAAGAVQVAEAKGMDKTISLELKGADIRDVLQMMAKMSGTNIVADKSVSGEISVALNEVPFQQALDMVIKANGFVYRWAGDILLVASEDRMSAALEEPVVETFTLEHADPEDVKKAISLIVSVDNIVAEPGSRTVIVKALPSQLGSVEKLIDTIDVEAKTAKPDLLTKVITLNYLDPMEAMDPIKEAVTGNLLLVPRGNALVVRGTTEQLETVTELLSSLDQPALVEGEPTDSKPALTVQPGEEKVEEPMVTEVIHLEHATTEAAKEALILVLPAENIRVLRENRTLAIRGTKKQVNEALALLAEVDKPVRQVLIEARVEEISLDVLRELGIDWEAVSEGWTLEQATEITNNNFSLAKVGADISATLKVLEEQGESVVLANPKVAVLDGEEANIHIGDRIPIVIDKKETDANGNVVITTSVEYIDVGIMLNVVPRINSQGYITAKVKPEVSSIVGQTNQGYPEIRTRTAETKMTLTNGETMVLGGLIQEEEIEKLSKVPVLGELPILGKLFQTTSKDKKQTEIIIFLTPTILPAPIQ